jgi:hypothetical protein
MGLRTCTVYCRDPKGVEHVVEVTADSLYEAVAQGLRASQDNDWIDEIGRGQTTLSVVVKQPEVQHTIRIQDFEGWLESHGRTPAEVSLKSRLRELLEREAPRQHRQRQKIETGKPERRAPFTGNVKPPNRTQASYRRIYRFALYCCELGGMLGKTRDAGLSRGGTIALTRGNNHDGCAWLNCRDCDRNSTHHFRCVRYGYTLGLPG